MLFLHKDWIIIIIMKTFILMAHLNFAFRRNTFQVRADRNNASLRNEDWRCNGTFRQEHYIHIFKQEQKYIYQMQMYDDNFVLRWQKTDNWELSWAHPMTFIFNCVVRSRRKKEPTEGASADEGFSRRRRETSTNSSKSTSEVILIFYPPNCFHDNRLSSGPRPHQHFRNRTTINLGEKRSRFIENIHTHV